MKQETSLEKGMKLYCYNTYTTNGKCCGCDDKKDIECYNSGIKMFKVALADQKAKIREWLLINCKKDGFCILNKEGLKKFEELKP